MNPDEVRPRRMLGQPSLGMGDDIHTATLQASPSRFGRGVFGKVVVKIEASVETRGESLAVENHGADKCGSVIALRFQQLGNGWMCARQRDAEIGDPVRARQET